MGSGLRAKNERRKITSCKIRGQMELSAFIDILLSRTRESKAGGGGEYFSKALNQKAMLKSANFYDLLSISVGPSLQKEYSGVKKVFPNTLIGSQNC